jgi:hypothetical protein
MQTQVDLRGQWGIMDQRALVDSLGPAVNVAIVLCDGFSLLDVSLVAEVFRQKNELSDAAHTIDRRATVKMLSSRGGYVTDSESVRIRTDAIDEYLSAHFDGVFVFGGDPKSVTSIDPADLRALRKVLLNASLVRWSDHGWGMIAASGYEPKSEGWRNGSQQGAKKHSYLQNDRSVVERGTNGLLAAALSFIPPDLCIEIAHRISRHLVSPSLDLSSFDEDALSEVSVSDRIHVQSQ